MKTIDRETLRLQRQVILDVERTADERNEMGQFATPPQLAQDIVDRALEIHGDRSIEFLEPSIGSGAFYSALMHTGRHVSSAVGCEVDHRFAELSRELWAETGLKVITADYTATKVTERASVSLVVANPPYSRHHHLLAEQKSQLAADCRAETGIKVSGLAGLYVHFVLLSHKYLAAGATSAWLIPAEFMDVNFGVALKSYLTGTVRLSQIHRYDPADAQFEDALVTSAVVFFENTPPTPEYRVRITSGGTPANPRRVRTETVDTLSTLPKWGPLFRDGFAVTKRNHAHSFGEFFKVSRGLSTGNNAFFIKPVDEARAMGITEANLQPILPSPRKLSTGVIERDSRGFPEIDDKLALLNTSLPPESLSRTDPVLARYLGTAPESVSGSYTARNRRPWYKQEQRTPAPFLCTYMGRGREGGKPFRFFWNKSDAVTTNIMLMLYPIGLLADALQTGDVTYEQVHDVLGLISAHDLRDGGRVYGGGLQKLEPSELRAFEMRDLAELVGL